MGRAFEFRLEPLLEARTRAVEARRRELFACRHRLAACEERLSRIAREPLTLTAFDLRCRDGLLRRVRTLDRACAFALEALALATRDRRVVETLKERRRRAFEAEEARREELELDEANARRHERASRKRVAR
jgi:flagellar biosynthesis chaperone FliJ